MIGSNNIEVRSRQVTSELDGLEGELQLRRRAVYQATAPTDAVCNEDERQQVDQHAVADGSVYHNVSAGASAVMVCGRWVDEYAGKRISDSRLLLEQSLAVLELTSS
eukprot:Lankesteria_metandrocarpae@DN5157_c0_g2_i1.p2